MTYVNWAERKQALEIRVKALAHFASKAMDATAKQRTEVELSKAKEQLAKVEFMAQVKDHIESRPMELTVSI